jgi:hypothetical protein
MGLSTGFECDPPLSEDLQFSSPMYHSDMRGFYSYLTPHFERWHDDELKTFVTHHNLDLSPLGKIVGEDIDLESYLQHLETDYDRQQQTVGWHQMQKEREQAWQSPSTLIACLEKMHQAVESDTGTLPDKDYFHRGSFKQDIEDLLKRVRWYEAQGIQRIRIFRH